MIRLVKINITIFLFTISILSAIAQSPVDNWYHSDRTESTPYTINTNKLYRTIIKEKKGNPVIVAVIDSGVDIEHEDLKTSIWYNSDEIEGNGIDDDKNGYIDDIYGWNFIGGPNGEQVGGDTYEMTRVYAELRSRFKDIDPNTLPKEAKGDYIRYQKYGKKIESSRASAKKSYDEILQTENLLMSVMDYISTVSPTGTISVELKDSLATVPERNASIASSILSNVEGQLGKLPTVSELREMLIKDIQGAKKYYGNKWKCGYNPDFDSRKIVGDDYKDLTNRYYGNNSVEGPDAMHGTHVAGIIAAQRNNDLGINGIANSAKIMVLRAVPDGDERDKDVANAIRYAVDNGASVINMSFGKGLSPQKQYVDDAVRYAEKHDVLIVHAAGNSSADIDTAANYPTDRYLNPKGFLWWKKKRPKNWLSIGASSNATDENMIASFSNYGKDDVDLFAPGEYMLSTTPDDNYEVQQGTSMAAPVVSGVAALIRSYFPSLTAQQIREILIETSQPIDRLVKRPGSEELVPFKDLSASGGIIDCQAAFIKAARTKGKKKIKKSKIGNGHT